MVNKIKQYEKASLLFQVVGWITFVIGILYITNSLSSGVYLIYSAGFSIIGLFFIVLGSNIKKRKLWAIKLGKFVGFLFLPAYPFGITVVKYLGKDWDKNIKPRVL